MLAKKRVLLAGVAVSAMLILLGCASKSTQSSGMESSATSMAVAGEPRESATQPVQPEVMAPVASGAGSALPVRFQKPSYLIKDTGLSDAAFAGYDR